jgi:hypothetical protein
VLFVRIPMLLRKKLVPIYNVFGLQINLLRSKKALKYSLPTVRQVCCLFASSYA